MGKTSEEVIEQVKEKMPVPETVEKHFREVVQALDSDTKPPVDGPTEPTDAVSTVTAIEVVETTEPSQEALQLPATAIVPKKPPMFDVAGVGNAFNKAGTWVKDLFVNAGKAIYPIFNSIGQFVLALIIGMFALLMAAVPFALYMIGWTVRGCYNAVMHGWNHKPVVEDFKQWFTEAMLPQSKQLELDLRQNS